MAAKPVKKRKPPAKKENLFLKFWVDDQSTLQLDFACPGDSVNILLELILKFQFGFDAILFELLKTRLPEEQYITLIQQWYLVKKEYQKVLKADKQTKRDSNKYKTQPLVIPSQYFASMQDNDI